MHLLTESLHYAQGSSHSLQTLLTGTWDIELHYSLQTLSVLRTEPAEHDVQVLTVPEQVKQLESQAIHIPVA